MLSTPTLPEMQLGTGTQPVLARVNERTIVAWKDGSNVVIKDIDKGEVQRVSGAYPSLVASPDGKRAYLVWETTEGNRIAPKFLIVQ